MPGVGFLYKRSTKGLVSKINTSQIQWLNYLVQYLLCFNEWMQMRSRHRLGAMEDAWMQDAWMQDAWTQDARMQGRLAAGQGRLAAGQ